MSAMDGFDSQLSRAVAAATTTRAVRIGAGCLDVLPDVVRQVAPDSTWLMVADGNTWSAAGARAAQLLAQGGIATGEPVVFAAQPRLKPDAEIARDLAWRLRGDRMVPLAVGSGVINDLVKYAAELAGVGYVSVPTAASMDGYAASGAALRDGGFKRTLPCAAPIAVVADLDVVASAPAAMAAWGYGDLVGKLVAGADWMLADALGEDALNPVPFAMVQDNLKAWLENPGGVRRGELGALDGLMRGLVMSGLAMQAHGNSRPASGSDHQFAHLWEMEDIAIDGLPVSHGACVGIGCLSMLAVYEWLLRQDMARIDPTVLAACAPSTEALKADIAAAFPVPFMAANAEIETLAKRGPRDIVEWRLSALRTRWPEIARYLRDRLPRADTVRRWLELAGAPASAAAVGIQPEKHARDYRRARLIRRRFTGLDVLHDLGWLGKAVGDLFEVGGFWGPAQQIAQIGVQQGRSR
jgi:glycerol-1-phosphate dehydrogenase [NAD(P)+]